MLRRDPTLAASIQRVPMSPRDTVLEATAQEVHIYCLGTSISITKAIQGGAQIVPIPGCP